MSACALGSYTLPPTARTGTAPHPRYSPIQLLTIGFKGIVHPKKMYSLCSKAV